MIKDVQSGIRKRLFIYRMRQPKKYGFMDFTEESIEKIIDQLSDLGFAVETLRIDVVDYRNYFTQAGYKTLYPNYYPNNLPEKSLEHYLAARLLNLSNKDVYIDIASEGSPVPEIYQSLYAAATYRQDLVYPPGLNGRTIGGDAGAMPVPDGFASKIGLHCSFEHFEGNADIRFIKEAKRVLIPGGKMCIIPLYLADEYAIVTDPEVSSTQKVTFERDAIVRFVDGWGNRHGRFYDTRHLVNRILNNLTDAKVKIYRIENFLEVDPSCYARFGLLMETNHTS